MKKMKIAGTKINGYFSNLTASDLAVARKIIRRMLSENGVVGGTIEIENSRASQKYGEKVMRTINWSMI